MYQFHIMLDSISKCRFYCRIVEKYRLKGYITVESRRIDAEDIIGIMQECLCRAVVLNVLCRTKQESREIEDLLGERKILITG